MKGSVVAVLVAMLLAAFLASSPTLALSVVGALVVVLVLVAVLIDAPRFLPWLLVILPSLAGLKRGEPVPGFRPAEVLLLALFAIALLRPLDRRSDGALRWRSVLAVLGAYSAWAAMAGFISSEQLSISFDVLAALGPLLLLLAGAWSFRRLLQGSTPHDRYRAAIGLAASSIPVAAVVFAQVVVPGRLNPVLISLTGSAALQERIARGDLLRATGTFGHWHSLGGYGVVVFAVALALLSRAYPSRSARQLLYASLASSLFCVLLTLTFISLLGVLVAALVIAWRSKRIVRLGLLGLVVATLLAPAASVVLQDRIDQQFERRVGSEYASDSSWLPQSVSFRLAIWTEQFVPAIEDRPLVGWGPENYPAYITWPHPESAYVGVLMRGGLPLLVLLLFLIRAVHRLAVEPAGHTSDRQIRMGLLGAIWGVAVISTMHPHFTDIGVPGVLMPLVGLAGAVPRTKPAPSDVAHRPLQYVGQV